MASAAKQGCLVLAAMAAEDTDSSCPATMAAIMLQHRDSEVDPVSEALKPSVLPINDICHRRVISHMTSFELRSSADPMHTFMPMNFSAS